MECPYCKKEMRSGYIPSSNSSISWFPDEEYPARVLSDRAVPLARDPWEGAVVRACYCPDCRRIVINVPELENHWKSIKDKLKDFTEKTAKQLEEHAEERREAQQEKEREKRRKKDPWED